MMRRSPVQAYFPPDTTWRSIQGMNVAWQIPRDAGRDRLAIWDQSFLPRWGVKGPGAAAWLTSQGLPVPSHPNQWGRCAQGGLIARLGVTEFLIEDSLATEMVAHLTRANRPPQVYPVLRQDLAIGLTGVATVDLLRQTCNVNVQALDVAEHPVVLTTMVGVNIVLILDERDGLPFYQLWCDNTFGPYLWHTLSAIAGELGGGPVGAAKLYDAEGGSVTHPEV
jgi:sarcosine oxidase subunit gamma